MRSRTKDRWSNFKAALFDLACYKSLAENDVISNWLKEATEHLQLMRETPGPSKDSYLLVLHTRAVPTKLRKINQDLNTRE